MRPHVNMNVIKVCIRKKKETRTLYYNIITWNALKCNLEKKLSFLHIIYVYGYLFIFYIHSNVNNVVPISKKKKTYSLTSHEGRPQEKKTILLIKYIIYTNSSLLRRFALETTNIMYNYINNKNVYRILLQNAI